MMPSCQDPQRRGPWQPAEDAKLLTLIDVHGPENWVKLSELVGTRTAKQCRERYHQKLKPDLNHAPISETEGRQIVQLYKRMGPRWAEIARALGNRSDNAVKNYWNGSQNRQKRDEQRRTRQHLRGTPHSEDHASSSLHTQQSIPHMQYNDHHLQNSHHHQRQQQQQHYHGHYDHHGHHHNHHYAVPVEPTIITLPAVRVPVQPTCHLPPLYPDSPRSQHQDGYRPRRSSLLANINTSFQPHSLLHSSPHHPPHWSATAGFLESPLSSPDSATFDQAHLNYSHHDAAEWRPATRDSSSTTGTTSSIVLPSYLCHNQSSDQAQLDVPRSLVAAVADTSARAIIPSIERDYDDRAFGGRDPRMRLNKILC